MLDCGEDDVGGLLNGVGCSWVGVGAGLVLSLKFTAMS